MLQSAGYFSEPKEALYVFQFTVSSGVGVGLVKQGVNVQFGPFLPTLVPSGQIFSSCVQAWGLGLLFRARYVPPTPNKTKIIIMGRRILLNINGFFGGEGSRRYFRLKITNKMREKMLISSIRPKGLIEIFSP